jgi:hypothetical protein
MNVRTVARRPITLTVLCYLYTAIIILTVLLFVRLYYNNPYATEATRFAYLVMMFSQLPLLASVAMMYFGKRAGIWLFLAGKILFFALPSLLAQRDLLGLMTPVFFIESAIFFILFGRQFQKRS